MAKKKAPKKKKISLKERFSSYKNFHLIIGISLILIAISLFISFTSYLWNWQADQSVLSEFWNRNIKVSNLLGKVGANLGHIFLYKWFGIASFVFVYLIGKAGLIISLKLDSTNYIKNLFKNLIIILWISVALGFFFDALPILGGTFGYEINDISTIYIGSIGVGIILFFSLIAWLVVRFNITPHSINEKLFNAKNSLDNWKSKNEEEIETDNSNSVDSELNGEDIVDEEFDIVVNNKEPKSESSDELIIETNEIDAFDEIPKCPIKEDKESNTDVADELEIETPQEEEVVDHIEHKEETKELSEQLVDEFGEYNPELELSHYKYPELEHLVEYDNENISIDRAELELNKNKIVETLNNYKIEISKIKATIGPTVTLYEIIPAPGVRISKIKNLEDDIALSLSALGIRIIAPIPGKGTIGIEVPNKKPTIVSMKSVLASNNFQTSEMELPLALGKTISNTTFVVDLAKMPHLLVAGATGQGKSVGLNAIMTSLLYKKHPSELKFVLVDPKKVELTLFNK
ncbi:MAG: DNA translocase FtsK 4TM domain-containing protein, partial [Mycoplasmataceae bacterium]|nr:DNA translocase FtsK 4TM domain-containing protein [Mycoplasmataceae bacterium]